MSDNEEQDFDVGGSDAAGEGDEQEEEQEEEVADEEEQEEEEEEEAEVRKINKKWTILFQIAWTHILSYIDFFVWCKVELGSQDTDDNDDDDAEEEEGEGGEEQQQEEGEDENDDDGDDDENNDDDGDDDDQEEVEETGVSLNAKKVQMFTWLNTISVPVLTRKISPICWAHSS